jgi:hypothetical protein
MNDHAKYIDRLHALKSRMNLNNNPWPPLISDLRVATDLLSYRNKDKTEYKKTDESHSEDLTIIMKNDYILQLLQYLTVLHLTLSDVFSSDIFSWDPLRLNQMKYEYEQYKKRARRLWGWTSNGVNFKGMVENGKINKMDITPFIHKAYCQSPVYFDMFLHELSIIITNARRNIMQIRDKYVYSEEKKPLLDLYDDIYNPYSYKGLRGGKHTSRKNRYKRKHRTRKH